MPLMIKSFGNKETEILFATGKVSSKVKWASIAKVAIRKLDMVSYASVLYDLKSPPGNHLEKLKGDYAGFHSIRINDQWRIVFKWENNDAVDVQIVDYHK